MIASGSGDLSEEHAGFARQLIEQYGEYYFGVYVDGNKRSKAHWKIADHGGGLYASTVGGQLTGMGADLLIIDDPVKNADEALSPTYRKRNWDWWQSTASTRLEPDAVVVFMNTRWHAEDLSGMLLEHEPDRWDVLSLPAIAEEDDMLGRKPGEALWPERYPIEKLLEIQKDKTSYWFGAMYQQHPGQYGEDSWPAAYFDDIYCEEEDWPKTFRMSVMAMDPAMGKDKKKGDYSANVFVGLANGKAWIDPWLGRCAPPQFIQHAVALWVKNKPTAVSCESNGFQSLVASQWRAAADAAGLLGVDCYEHIAQGDKISRIEAALTPLLARGMLKVRKTIHGRKFVAQCKAIPNGEHDDGPDAAAQAMKVLQDMASSSVNDNFGRSIYERAV